MSLQGLFADDVTGAVPLARLHRHRLLADLAQADALADLRLGLGLAERALEVLAPYDLLSLIGLDLHEVGDVLVRVVLEVLAPVIEEFAEEVSALSATGAARGGTAAAAAVGALLSCSRSLAARSASAPLRRPSVRASWASSSAVGV